MQTLRSAIVPLLFAISCAFPALAAAKAHTVALGTIRKVPYTPPEAGPDDTSEAATTLRIRPLLVDSVLKEWTVGDTHEVTDRTFVVRRALHLNDALPGEPARWTWQPGPWLMVDRITAHITALHLPEFDPQVSDVVWFRDYAAYCGIYTVAKTSSVVAIVAELGTHKAVAQKWVGPWPDPMAAHPVCARAAWQRTPMRATIKPASGAALIFDVVGTSSLIEEGEEE